VKKSSDKANLSLTLEFNARARRHGFAASAINSCNRSRNEIGAKRLRADAVRCARDNPRAQWRAPPPPDRRPGRRILRHCRRESADSKPKTAPPQLAVAPVAELRVLNFAHWCRRATDLGRLLDYDLKQVSPVFR
jgi:hypothetical protein